MRSTSAFVRSLVVAAALPAAAAAACADAGLPTQATVEDAGAGGRLYRVEPSAFPFYSRTEPPADVGGYGYRTDEWAAVVFYRDPGCVPGDFNLFAFYDFELAPIPGGMIPRVFLCEPTVQGFSLHLESMGMTPPKQSQLSGTAVPIWFVPWEGAFANAVAAGQLTIVELEGMPGLLKGTATRFHEGLATTSSHPRPRINITAGGTLEDGRGFAYNVVWNGLTVADVQHVSIRFD